MTTEQQNQIELKELICLLDEIESLGSYINYFDTERMYWQEAKTKEKATMVKQKAVALFVKGKMF